MAARLGRCSFFPAECHFLHSFTGDVPASRFYKLDKFGAGPAYRQAGSPFYGESIQIIRRISLTLPT